MSTNKLRNMSADESIELLKELRSILEERAYFRYNTSLINPFQEQISLIDTVMTKYVPGDDTNILDVHGMAIVNSILKINAISKQFTIKFTSNAMRYVDEEEYSLKITNVDNEFISFMDSKGYDGNAELSRIKKLLYDFSGNTVRIRPVNLTEYGSEENITEAFDYHLLIYLIKCLRAENEIYKSKRSKFEDLRRQSQSNGNLKMFHTSYFNDVSTCRSSCVGLCSASCDETCYGCGGGCAGQCTAACADCSSSCINDCAENCTGGCNGCSGCSNECDGCIGTCSGNCGDECTNGCGGCTGSCFGTTSGAVVTCGCGGICTTNCSTDCNSSASAPTVITVDQEPPIVIEPNLIPTPVTPVEHTQKTSSGAPSFNAPPNNPLPLAIPVFDDKGKRLLSQGERDQVISNINKINKNNGF